jgi:nucleotide-binding universal stress UspA family protein
MKRILVPVDLSGATVRVCNAAADLAKALGSQLVILHAVPSLPPAIYGFDAFTAAQVVAFNRKARKASAHKLQALQHWFNKRLPGTKMALHEGPPADVILQSASRINPDYIVIGSHGHGAMHDLIAGSTTREILRKSPCPVVLVPITKSPGKPRVKTPRTTLAGVPWIYD